MLGVSPDPVKQIAKFDDKYGLGFPLLADADHAVAEAYGVWVEKSMYGRTYMGNERSTFVIDADGEVQEVFRKVKPASTTSSCSARWRASQARERSTTVPRAPRARA